MIATLFKDISGISPEKKQRETELIQKQKHCSGSLEEEGITMFYQPQSRNTHLSTGPISQFKCGNQK